MEQIITFRTAPAILFGNHVLEHISDIVKSKKAKRILIITDKGIVGCGLLAPLKARCNRSERASLMGLRKFPGK
jgi:alcohol dehydrogenase class IV